MTDQELAIYFSALANQRRLKIFRILLNSSSPLTPTLISAMSGIEPPQTSDLLSTLLQADLVLCQRHGRHKLYAVNQIVIDYVKNFLTTGV